MEGDKWSRGTFPRVNGRRVDSEVRIAGRWPGPLPDAGSRLSRGSSRGRGEVYPHNSNLYIRVMPTR